MELQIPHTRNELATYLANLGLEKGAEIGVEQGAFTEVLCKAGLEVYAIDAWQAYKGYRDHVNQAKLDRFYENVKQKMKPYLCHVIKGFSMNVKNGSAIL